MKAKMFSGEQVPVFVDFGIVSKEHVVLSKSDQQVAVSVSEESEDVIVVEAQVTVPHNHS